MQFIDNIFLLQYSKKEIVTAKEVDLRLLGKVIIFRDKQTNRQNLPIIYRSIENQCRKKLAGSSAKVHATLPEALPMATNEPSRRLAY